MTLWLLFLLVVADATFQFTSETSMQSLLWLTLMKFYWLLKYVISFLYMSSMQSRARSVAVVEIRVGYFEKNNDFEYGQQPFDEERI